MHKTSTLILLVLLAASASASAAKTTTGKPAVAPAAVTAQQKEQAPNQYVQIREMAALGSHCSWLTPIEQTAVEISGEERLAWLTWQKVDLVAVRDRAAAAVKQAEAADCKALTDKRKGAQFGSWQMRSSWALRGYSMLPMNTHPAWFAGKSTVAAHSDALEAAYKGLLAYSATSVPASVQMFDQTTPSLLSVRCKSKEAGCPTATTDKGERRYAETIIKLTERYAAALESADDKTGIPKALIPH